MDLSIVIVNWNSRDFLAQAIEAVESTVTGLRYEIVVIDSGSFDGCGDMLRDHHPRAKFIQSERNVGFARANNEAFGATLADTLLFLNPDTKVVGTAIEDLYRALHSRPEAGIVGPRLLNSDGSVQETCIRALPTLLNQLLDSDLLRASFPKAGLWGKRELTARDAAPKRVEAVSGACLMMRRSLFERVGMFSIDYFMYSEDMDLCLKARQAGGDTYFVPTATVFHYGGGSSGQAGVSAFAAVMRLESQWRYFRKTRSPTYAAMYRASMLCASLIRLAALILVWPLQALRCGQFGATGAMRKWTARLRWASGGERWVRNY